ncbi:unnamed protein product [Symbiodinium pilosum]|uniref:Ubiquitin-like domain-containing protein n=1 Tax=Symbiodinium pilosum TaxID=2952 RepID=A0A812X0U7_SYMPI|nr:unnamed protein product [Symbiodinium pilosum]
MAAEDQARKIQQAFRRMQTRAEEQEGSKEVVIVNLPGEEVLKVRCAPGWNVLRLKREVSNALKIPLKEVQLAAGTRKLRDEGGLVEVLEAEEPVVSFTRVELRAVEDNAASTIGRLWRRRR